MSQSILNNISDYLENHKQGARLTLTAVAASVLTATTLISYQRITRSRLQKDKKALKRAINEEPPAIISIIDEEKINESNKEPMDETLVLELLARNTAFFGLESVNKIRQSFVVILGAGAIGSWTALMLVRSGVEHVRIIDPGYVRLESMTRNAVAKIADIGKSKALILKKHIADIAPNAHIEVEHTPITQDNMAKLLADGPDFVVDTLPNVRDKVLVAKYCKEHKIKIVSAMSAGAKADPTLIQVTDKELAAKEQCIFNNATGILNANDVGYIFDELWQGKSVISGSQDRTLVMTRWDSSQPSSLLNTVVMTKVEANLHDKLPLGTDLSAHYGPYIVEKVKEQFALEKKLQELWNAHSS
ncbi:hypothetical protein [Parasitella parasitica]|uniref:THIF-type NAD/FAD binding fold domain-containing protein n=1 Tax=Parasitella parasitica TaxID=35722 RepID=A0A0B7NDE4_9FUNG|nr:hypothetical protein [Parasitella parasitica]